MTLEIYDANINIYSFTQQGSINIFVLLENEMLIISVTDTGISIIKNVKSHIFEAFILVDNQNAEQGSGPGLTICKVLMSNSPVVCCYNAN